MPTGTKYTLVGQQLTVYGCWDIMSYHVPASVMRSLYELQFLHSHGQNCHGYSHLHILQSLQSNRFAGGGGDGVSMQYYSKDHEITYMLSPLFQYNIYRHIDDSCVVQMCLYFTGITSHVFIFLLISIFLLLQWQYFSVTPWQDIFLDELFIYCTDKLILEFTGEHISFVSFISLFWCYVLHQA